MGDDTGTGRDEALAKLARLRQHQRDGRRSPHKPLLVLLALGRMAAVGSSRLPWHDARAALGDLVAEFGPASNTSRVQGAAYPFTRLRTDGIWILDHDVPMDTITPLNATDAVGQFTADLESLLRSDPGLVASAARALVESHFPPSIAPDVLAAVGLDPDAVLHSPDAVPDPDPGSRRRRDPRWRDAVIQAWDRQCAFCGFDGQFLGATVGIDAAHVRWFALDGPDDLDNGLALCVLHHKLFDRGVLGIDTGLRLCVSTAFTARTPAGKAIYDLHGRLLQGRPGTLHPAPSHLDWHRDQVFKGQPLPV
ncbi:phosphorothioated DNA-binding restriction endonuclease [Catellatospora coxensis]|uniref:HNH endonuclease n=1 Tax=Catellatospora coxensis TaxID=310354 RepID=A0A8J3L2X8_9ACTN|nr:HNH endonuclease [Catellatospora coxensis]GIG05670.1 HNH endonuclease [Catellatospora coxensis]